jgi:uncharacterized membrane protein
MTSTNITKSTVLAASALALALSVNISSPSSALAQEGMEKCYGVAAAGKNDCATATSSCAGTSASDNQTDAFIYLPAGTCSKVTGGSLESSAS